MRPHTLSLDETPASGFDETPAPGLDATTAQGLDGRPILVIGGPTAAGKTALAVALAEKVGFPVFSADSRQIYRHMDIGTAKPSPKDLARAPHELIDIRNPDEDFSVSAFLAEAAGAAKRILPGMPLIIAGGTGLYIRALLEGLADLPGPDFQFRASLEGLEDAELHTRLIALDPDSADRIHPRNRVRVVRALEIHAATGRPMSSILGEHREKKKGLCPSRYEYFVVHRPRSDLDALISDRVDAMMNAGLVEEVEKLVSMGYGVSLPSMSSIGYREIIGLLSGAFSLADAVEAIKVATRQFSKRQMTWFRSERRARFVDLCEKGFDATLSEMAEAWARLCP